MRTCGKCGNRWDDKEGPPYCPRCDGRHRASQRNAAESDAERVIRLNKELEQTRADVRHAQGQLNLISATVRDYLRDKPASADPVALVCDLAQAFADARAEADGYRQDLQREKQHASEQAAQSSQQLLEERAKVESLQKQIATMKCVCPSCGDKDVTTSRQEQQFPYGIPAVTLTATVTVFTCQKCGEAYTDGDGEDARTDAVCRHLQGRIQVLEAALHRDKTGLGAALAKVLSEVRGRSWLGPDGNWASYSYEDHTTETLRKEIGWAFDAIEKLAQDALCESGSLAHDALTMDGPVALLRACRPLVARRAASKHTPSGRLLEAIDAYLNKR